MLPRMPWFAHPEAGHYNTDRVCETGKCRKGSPVRRAMPLAPKESSLNKFGEFPVVGVLWMVSGWSALRTLSICPRGRLHADVAQTPWSG